MTASENDDPLASFLKNKASDKKMSDFKLMKENPKVPGNAILAKDKTNGELVVIKTLHNLMNKYQELEISVQEIKHLLNLSHPHLNPILDAFSTQNGDVIYTTKAYLDGDLREEIEKRKKSGSGFTEKEIINIISQITSALVYAHAHNVAHTDLRPANIHMSGTNVVLANLGTCLFEEFTGPVEYRAPEGKHLKYHSPIEEHQKEDCWSLGVLLYELYYLERPGKKFDFSKGTPKFVKSICQNLIRRLPNDRWTMQQVFLELLSWTGAQELDNEIEHEDPLGDLLKDFPSSKKESDYEVVVHGGADEGHSRLAMDKETG